MKHLTVTAAAAMLLFIATQSFAQTAENTIAHATSSPMKVTERTISSGHAQTLLAIKALAPEALQVLTGNYTDLQDLSYSKNASMLHTFFSEYGNGVHVIFGKNQKQLLEVITYGAENYPATLVMQLQKSVPKANIVVVKKITGQADTWYEVLIKNNDTLEKIEIAAW